MKLKLDLEEELKQVSKNRKTRGGYQSNRAIINLDTNEIENVIYEDDVVEVKQNQVISLKEAKRKEEFRKFKESENEFNSLVAKHCGKFYFYFSKELIDMKISNNHKTRFLFLSTYANYTENGGYLTYDNNKIIDRKGIENLLKLKSTAFKLTLKVLTDNELLIEDDIGFRVDSSVSIRGKLEKGRDIDNHTRVFDEGLRNLYNGCSPEQHKQLYYLFKLLPLINLKFNAICYNPEEEIPNKVNPLTIKQICEYVKYNKSNSSKFEMDMYRLRIYDQRVIQGIKNEHGIWFKTNPRLYYGGTSGHLLDFTQLLSNDFSISTNKIK